MKFRAWLALVLFAHVLGHPLVHALSFGAKPPGQTVVSAQKAAPQTTRPIEDCVLCRQSAALEQAPAVFFSPEQRASGYVFPTQYAHVSLEFQHNVPARAPPAL